MYMYSTHEKIEMIATQLGVKDRLSDADLIKDTRNEGMITLQEVIKLSELEKVIQT